MPWFPLDISSYQRPNGPLFENLPPKLSLEGPYLGAGSQGFLLAAAATSVNLSSTPVCLLASL